MGGVDSDACSQAYGNISALVLITLRNLLTLAKQTCAPNSPTARAPCDPPVPKFNKNAHNGYSWAQLRTAHVNVYEWFIN